MSIVNSLGTTTLYEYHTCPKCGSANLDIDHTMVYTSNPPCYRYTCRDCLYVGFTSNFETSNFAGACEVSKPKEDKTKSDCEKCQNKDICKYKERFEKFMQSPDPYAGDLDFVEVIIKCKYYKEEIQLSGGQTLKINTPGEIRLDTTTNPCLKCEHHNKPYHSIISPCQGCSHDKNTLGYTITPNGTDDVGKVLRVNDDSIVFENADGTITTRTYTNKENTESE